MYTNGLTQSVWSLAICLTVYSIMTLIMVPDLGAQSPSSTTSSVQQKEPPDFTGTWRLVDLHAQRPGYSRGRGFDEFVACKNRKDASGAPMIRCSQPWEATGGAKFGIKDFLNNRAMAWMEFRDEIMSTKHLCIENTLPALVDMWLGTVYKMGPGQIRILYLADEMGDGIYRDVWMDGRKHPDNRELYYQGHSIGWYEGDELVIETTNFTFDPDGLEDHLHIPSSSAKKLTERWKKTGPNEVSVTYTQEDKLFLKKPWTWTWVYEKTALPDLPATPCSPETAWDEAIVTGSSKYDDQ